MGLRLLGPLELVVEDRPVKIGGPKERIVLATLALNPNRVISIDHLVDAIWPASPPSSARSQIQKCVSALRRLFGDEGQPGTIRTCPPGYVLEIPAGDLDSEDFVGLVSAARALVGDGRVTEAAARLRTALSLWRGPALDGVPSELVRRGAARLEEARLTATEERVRLDLELGLHENTAAELRALIDEHPLREKLYGFLMLALYRSGRQAEALAVGRRARTTLIDEIGVEPGQELRDLERAILNHDPTIERRPTVAGTPAPTGGRVVTPRQLPGCTADFVGREHDIDEIKRFLSDDGGTDPYAVRIVAISGRGGVGKSTLALRAAHELSSRFPDGHLYADLQGLDGEEHTTTLLARFLRALGVAGTAVPADVRERAELYRSMLAEKRMLVVLDGASTERQVSPLLPGAASCPVIVTSQTRLTGLPGARWIDVTVFDTDKSVDLLVKIIGRERVRAELDAAVNLVALCGGLPLTLRIAGGRLLSRPQWRIAGLVQRLADEARRLDEFTHRGLELRSSIGLTYRSLPAPARRLFRLFAMVEAPDFPAWTAAALLDTDATEADDALTHLLDAHVLDVLAYPGERFRYRFHDLIRIYAHEQLLEVDPAAERRAALARVLGAWLALAEEAHRREYGGDYTVLHGGAPRWHVTDVADPDSVDVPQEWWESERRALVTAVRQAAKERMDELCWDLALTSVSLFEVKGYLDDWRETAQVAMDACEGAGNRVGQAAMLYSLGTLHLQQRRLAESGQCFTRALELFEAEGSLHGCALVLRNAASVDRLRGHFTLAHAKYTDALAMIRTVDDPVCEAYILRNLATFRIDDDDTDGARVLLDDALSLCQRVNYHRGEAQVRTQFAELHLSTGDIGSARQELHRVLRIVRDIGDRIGETHALYGMGLVRRQEGKLDNAETTLTHAFSLANQVGERLVEARAHHALGGIDFARGRHPAAISHLAEARKLFNDLGSMLWSAKTLILLSEVHESDGELSLSRQEFEEARRLLSRIDATEAARLLAQLAET